MATIRAKLFQTAYGQNVMNVLHFNKPDFVISELDGLALEIRDHWIMNVRAVQTADLLYQRISLHVVGSAAAPTDLVISISGAASAQNEMVPYFCHLIQIRTGLGGRRGRGRVYMAMVNPLLHFRGTLTAGFLALWTTPLANVMSWFGPSGTSAWRIGVNPHNETDDFKPATSLQLATITAVQRRRNIGVGV